MFYRNGQALGSVNSTELKAVAEPKPVFKPVAPKPVAPKPEPLTVPDLDPALVPAPEPAAEAAPAVVARPAVTDRKAEWVDFAVAQGVGRDEADALTKAELVELFGDDKR